jgi:stearoyl-CoA desaturase (delta-9 desaturase)
VEITQLATDFRPRWTTYIRTTTVLFWAVHVAAVLGVVWCGLSWRGVGLALASYYVRMFVVTAAYHRYFSHRAFKTSRWFQFLLAVGAQSAAQNGVVWWAGHHRWHHKHSDKPEDVHSAKLRGFWYAHLGWIMRSDWNDTDERMVADLARFPELRWLNKPVVHILPTVALAVGFALIGGAQALVWGYFVSLVLLWHGCFSINSLAHVIGHKRYATDDESRNHWLLALLTTGEGWHNNHHHYQSSANQGFEWWQIDVTYYLLRLMAAVGLIWDLRRPPQAVIDAPRPAQLEAMDATTSRAA